MKKQVQINTPQLKRKKTDIYEDNSKSNEDPKSSKNDNILKVANEYMNMMSDICNNLYFKKESDVNFNYNNNISNANLSNMQGNSIYGKDKEIDKTRTKNMLQTKSNQNEIDKDKLFFKFIFDKSDSEIKPLKLLNYNSNDKYDYYQGLDFLAHKMISGKIDYFEKISSNMNNLNSVSNNETILLNLFMALSQESFDLIDSNNKDTKSAKKIRNHIMNTLGLDYQNLNIKREFNNEIASYILGNFISLKKAYKNVENSNNNNANDYNINSINHYHENDDSYRSNNSSDNADLYDNSFDTKKEKTALSNNNVNNKNVLDININNNLNNIGFNVNNNDTKRKSKVTNNNTTNNVNHDMDDLNTFEEVFETFENKILFDYERKINRKKQAFGIKVMLVESFTIDKDLKFKNERLKVLDDSVSKIASFMKTVKNPFKNNQINSQSRLSGNNIGSISNSTYNNKLNSMSSIDKINVKESINSSITNNIINNNNNNIRTDLASMSDLNSKFDKNDSMMKLDNMVKDNNNNPFVIDSLDINNLNVNLKHKNSK